MESKAERERGCEATWFYEPNILGGGETSSPLGREVESPVLLWLGAKRQYAAASQSDVFKSAKL